MISVFHFTLVITLVPNKVRREREKHDMNYCKQTEALCWHFPRPPFRSPAVIKSSSCFLATVQTHPFH